MFVDLDSELLLEHHWTSDAIHARSPVLSTSCAPATVPCVEDIEMNFYYGMHLLLQFCTLSS